MLPPISSIQVLSQIHLRPVSHIFTKVLKFQFYQLYRKSIQIPSQILKFLPIQHLILGIFYQIQESSKKKKCLDILPWLISVSFHMLPTLFTDPLKFRPKASSHIHKISFNLFHSWTSYIPWFHLKVLSKFRNQIPGLPQIHSQSIPVYLQRRRDYYKILIRNVEDMRKK